MKQLVTFFATFLTVIALSIPAAAMAESVITVTCVGDSNTQGRYPTMLGEALGAGWNVIDCGRYATTTVTYQEMPQYQAALASNPDIVLIMLGTNDAHPGSWRRTRDGGTPEEVFKTNYLRLITSFQALESQPKIVMVVPPPVYPDKVKKSEKAQAATQSRNDNLIHSVIPLVREIAAEQNLPLIDLHTIMLPSPELSADGVHFHKDGYRTMSQIFATRIREVMAAP